MNKATKRWLAETKKLESKYKQAKKGKLGRLELMWFDVAASAMHCAIKSARRMNKKYRLGL